MKTVRIQKGVYSVRVGDREFYIEQVCAERPETGDKSWMMTEVIGANVEYCNHFKTKRDAIEALKEVERQYPKVVGKGKNRYAVECGDYAYAVYKLGRYWYVDRGMFSIYAKFETMKEALAFVKANASRLGGVEYMLTQTSVVVKAAGYVYEVTKLDEYGVWELAMCFDGSRDYLDCSLNVGVMIRSLEFHAGIRNCLIPIPSGSN